MCQTNPDVISVDENVDLLAAKAITDKYNVCIGGNIPLTTVMLHGTQQDNMKYVIDLLDHMPDKRNFILSPGCDMPYAVPVENTIGVVQAVTQPDEVREMVKIMLRKTMISKWNYRTMNIWKNRLWKSLHWILLPVQPVPI